MQPLVYSSASSSLSSFHSFMHQIPIPTEPRVSDRPSDGSTSGSRCSSLALLHDHLVSYLRSLALAVAYSAVTGACSVPHFPFLPYAGWLCPTGNSGWLVPLPLDLLSPAHSRVCDCLPYHLVILYKEKLKSKPSINSWPIKK